MDGATNVKIKVQLFDKVDLTKIQETEALMYLHAPDLENIDKKEKDTQLVISNEHGEYYLTENSFREVM